MSVTAALTLVSPSGLSVARADSRQPAPPIEPSVPASRNEVTGKQAASVALASQTLARAKALFETENYDGALAEFTRAYRLLAGHPRRYAVLNNIAVCHERMFRYELALDLYERYLAEAPESEPDRGEVNAVVRTMRSLLATIEIDSRVPATVWVDARNVGRAPGRLLIPSGRHTLELRAELYEPEQRELQLAAGETRRLAFELRRLSTYSGPRHAYFWASLGASAVALATGAAFGGAALAARNNGREKAALYIDSRREAERARKFSLAADGCFATGLLFGVTSVVLYFVTDWSNERESQLPARPARARPSLNFAFEANGRVDAIFSRAF